MLKYFFFIFTKCPTWLKPNLLLFRIWKKKISFILIICRYPTSSRCSSVSLYIIKWALNWKKEFAILPIWSIFFQIVCINSQIFLETISLLQNNWIQYTETGNRDFYQKKQLWIMFAGRSYLAFVMFSKMFLKLDKSDVFHRSSYIAPLIF